MMLEAIRRFGSAPPSPRRVLLLMLAIVFGVEMGIMLMFMWFPTLIEGDLARSVADALTLTAVVSPAFWLLIVSPLRVMFEERGRLLTRLFHAQELERASLSRDLHDELGQQLTVMLLRLGAAERATELSSAKESLRDAHAMAVRTLESVRSIARGLGPGVLTGLGLHAALDRLCEDFDETSGTTFDLRYDLPHDTRFANDIEITIYRIVQEACTNIMRHAGSSSAAVTVSMRNRLLHLEIRDNGRGLSANETSDSLGAGLGISGIRERALSLGGFVTIASGRQEGTTITVEIPGVTTTVESQLRGEA